MKPVYRSSQILNYFTCPKSYDLSTQYDITTTSMMRDGLLFENYLFGFRTEELRTQLEGRKQPKTLEPIREKADYVRNKYKFVGDSFIKIQIEFDDFILQGELDFKGKFIHSDNVIVDIKFTNNIDKIWNFRNSKAEYIQAVMYPLLDLLNKNKGELIFDDPADFYYVIVENNSYTEPLVKILRVDVVKEDLIWMWNKIVQIHKAKSIGYPAIDNIENCLGVGAYSGRCSYIEFCKEGREQITLPNQNIIEFNQLNERK